MSSVTLRDIYDAVNSLEAKLDRRLEKAESDIEKLKADRNQAMGILTLVSIFIGGLASFVWSKILGK